MNDVFDHQRTNEMLTTVERVKSAKTKEELAAIPRACDGGLACFMQCDDCWLIQKARWELERDRG